MKKTFVLWILIILLITGCNNEHKNNNDEDKAENDMTYAEMGQQLIDYRDKVLDELDTKEKGELFISLDELSNKYNYDISMFVNTSTGKLCDTKESGILIKIDENGIDKNNVSTKLVCGDGESEVDSFGLYKQMIKYLDDIYNNDTFLSGEIKPSVNVITLRELKEKGYDISMFVNKKTNKLCDLDLTKGTFEVLGTNEDGTVNYEYHFDYDCSSK